MNPVQQTVGSPIWQLVFISFAVVLVLFEIVRGWRLGLMRQIMRLLAVVAGAAVAWFGGQLLVPVARPLLKTPDVVLMVLCSVALFLLVYFVISGIGTVIFKKTRQQNSAIVRFLWGLTGAAIGLFFGAFLVWVIVIGVRSLGTVADAHVREQASNPPAALHAVDVRRGLFSEATEVTPSLMTTLARLKNSLEMGTVGGVVKKTDAIPSKTYETLGKISQVASNPQMAERFLSFPGAQELSENPRIVALRDPKFQELLEQGRFLELLQDQRLIDALNDPELLDQLRRFDLQRALDYAITGR